MGAGGGGHMIFYVKDIANRRPLIAALENFGLIMFRSDLKIKNSNLDC